MLEFQLLGEVAVLDDGQPLPVQGPKQRGLLAMLLLARSGVVSRHELILGLWGETAPPRVEHALDAQVSTLRRALGPASVRLTRRSFGYALHLESGELDLERFDRARTEALVSTDHVEVAARLREALGMWHGPPLADVRSMPFASVAADALEEQRIAVLEDRLEADLLCGLGAELVAEVEALVAAQPFRERPVVSLATALYRSGRQAAALEVIASARRRFAQELGIDTGPSVEALQRRILQRDPTLMRTPRQPAEVTIDHAQRRNKPIVRLVAVCVLTLLMMLAAGDAIRATRPASGAQAVVLDAGSGRVLGRAPLTLNATTAAGDDTAVWFADPDDHVVVRVDPSSGAVTARLNVDSSPLSIATGDGAVWVVGSASVSRIDADTLRLTQTIALPGQPTAAAYGAGRLWVLDETSRTLTRIRPGEGQVERAVKLPSAPTALAVSGGVVWVASYATSTVTAIDAHSLTPVTTVAVGRGPVALAAAGRSVWVANSLDGTVSRIDVGRPRVEATISVGGAPQAVALAGYSLWVAGETRSVTRIDTRTNAVSKVPVPAQPTALAEVGDAIVMASPPGMGSTGGTLRQLAASGPTSIDPAQQILLRPAEFLGLAHDGLVTYDHTSGIRGLRLVPDLADALPASSVSTTLQFRLRAGVRYSTGRDVRASDFRRAFERLFRSASPGVDYYRGIVGAGSCGPDACDLRRGVVTDDASRTVTFHLGAPDADFLDKLAALNFAAPVPPGTPMRDTGRTPVPGTGPYQITRSEESEVRFERNPYFHEWSRAAQPAGIPDTIVWTFGSDPVTAAGAVLSGEADRSFESVPIATATTIANRYSAQSHANDLLQTDFLQLSPRSPPFDDVRARRALNLAVDRGEVVRRYGGPDQASPTCQVLPPGIRGHSTYCPWTRGDGTKGWSAPDLPRARRLVAASGTSGDRVVVWTFSDVRPPKGVMAHVVATLRLLGYRVTVRSGDHDDYARLGSQQRRAIDLIPSSWLADYPSPSSFFDTQLTCSSVSTGGFWCDPGLDRLLRRARSMEATDPTAADALWSRADERAVDRAAWVPLVNTRELDLLSDRVRGYRYGPVLGFIASQSRLTGP